DDATGRAREARPIGPELELERDARHDAHGEVDREDAPPEARGAVVVRLAAPERRRLEDHDEEREPHRQRREEVVVGGREGEVDAVGGDGVHSPTPPSRRSSEASPYSPAPAVSCQGIGTHPPHRDRIWMYPREQLGKI